MSKISSTAIYYCILLAFQFGLHPKLAKVFQNECVNKSSIVILTEFTKILIALITLPFESKVERSNIINSWSIKNSLTIAALPAILYAIQNLTTQYAYPLTDPMTFNLLNQTKTLAAAFWLYIIMGKKQSYIQVFALILLLVAAIILTSKTDIIDLLSSKTVTMYFQKDLLNGGFTWEIINIFKKSIDMKTLGSNGLGIMLVLTASMISGISTALTEKTLQLSGNGPKRNSIFLSAEMAVYAIVFLLISDNLNSNKETNEKCKIHDNFFAYWDIYTFIPVLSNAFGGLIVGLVTKHAGGILKGFALIAGLILTAFVSWIVDMKKLRSNDWVAMIIVALSIYLHSNHSQIRDMFVTKKKEKTT